MENLAIVILAAGKGTRMGQEKPKVLTETYQNISLIEHVLRETISIKPTKTIVVTGYGAKDVETNIKNSKILNDKTYNLEFATQKEQLGTGDAVKSALPLLSDFKGTVVILYGDVPLLKASPIKGLISLHEETKATLSFIVLSGDNKNSYGRVIKDEKNQIKKIIEYKDCSDFQKLLTDTNSGIYAVDSAFLKPALEDLKNNNAQKEYYLTDIVEKASNEGQTISALYIKDSIEVQGVNTPNDLRIVNEALRKERLEDLQNSGVLFKDIGSVYIDNTVTIEPTVEIGPNVTLLGNTIIKKGAVLEGTNYIVNSIIDENVLIRFSVRIEDSEVGKNTKIGPFAHLRPKAKLAEDVHIGNFVEVKNATLASGAKANHLAYIGDAEIGKNVNVGAGTIFANYDGVNKNKAIVHDNVFIGSNSVLIAPIEVGENATIGAGSVVAKKVESNCLTVTRANKTVKKDWKRPSKK
jgi:bifunctional UDP-N-acetylglucosamine pyrophosphorylase/glucosamine-1-phosphate N-acetyltransferase